LEGVELGREAPTPEPALGAFGQPAKGPTGATPNQGPEKPPERKETRKEDDDDDGEDD
jgi:hypothetical protein